MKDFYYAQDWGTMLDVPNILLSYGVVLYPNGRIRPFDLSHAENVFLDCGAYTLRGKFTKYPIDDYIEWVRSFEGDNIRHVATVDIIGDYERTVKAGLECVDLDSSIPWIPVLQGVTINDYSECARLYETAGVDLSDRLVAVGGLKKRQNLTIRSILGLLKRFKIHAFGLTLANLKDPNIWNNVFSADSGMWKKRPNTTAEKYRHLEQFKIELERLRQSYRQQSIL